MAGAGRFEADRDVAWGERSFYCADPDARRCLVDDSMLFLGRGAAWS